MKAFLFSFTQPMLCPPDVSVKNGGPSTRLPPEAGKQDERHGEGGRASAVGPRRPPCECHVIPPPCGARIWPVCVICEDSWQVRGERWKGKVGKTGISFGNFVFLGLRSNSGIRSYADGHSYLRGEDGLQWRPITNAVWWPKQHIMFSVLINVHVLASLDNSIG
jgi:hypothetical protein